MSQLKYPDTLIKCAVCGGELTGKGWFCSQRCDDEEMNGRIMNAKPAAPAAHNPTA